MSSTLSNAENEARALLSNIVYLKQVLAASHMGEVHDNELRVHINQRYAELGMLVPALLDELDKVKKG
jgi:hypothetical protein